jgi:hypothetical protein
MRRLIPVVTVLALVALGPAYAALAAQPRVLPTPTVQILVTKYLNTDSPDTATLTVSGHDCVPLDAPASVLVTVDRIPGQVFTATPTARGRWSVDIDLATPVDGTYVIDAECDNYFGNTAYPEVTAGPAEVLVVEAVAASAGSPGGGGTGGVANTGTRTTTEIEVGLAAIGAGALLLWAGRPRRRGMHVE